MCGIVGVMRLDGPIDLDSVERGRDSLRHRGPDGPGLWTTCVQQHGRPLTVALAHQRLSILDLSERGDQPLLIHPDGEVRPARPRDSSEAAYVISFNGEIYNFVELRAELQGLGHRFRSTGDTEVLLRAYAEWGESCLDRLNGMFAFAIWDHAQSALVCARDRFGEKPFHWTLDPTLQTLAFASEIKALVAAGFAWPELDERAVYRYLRYREQNGVEQTVWRDVRRLAPGHVLVARVRANGLHVTTRAYWRPRAEPDFSGTEADATQAFRELFRDSVAIRLRSDVSVGTSLSGGLDSSSVLCQIHELQATAGQHAFTARMDDPSMDEGRFVKAVLARTGVKGHDVMSRATDLIDHFDHLCAHQEEPFASTSILASYLVHRLAAEHAVVVMLDGQGADEYLAGYAHYPAVRLTALARSGRVGAWWRERRALKEWRGVDPVPPRAALRLWLGRRAAWTAIAVDDDVGAHFLTADTHARWGDEGPRTIDAGSDPLRARLVADLTMGHLQELLRYADRNSMAWSREVRLPFLDHRLVELCLSLPTEYLLRGGESKRILRRAMRRVVPDEILDRRDKVGFVVPWADWWHGHLRDALSDRLSAALRELAGMVDPVRVAPGTPEALAIMSLAQARSSLHAVRARAHPIAHARTVA
jgi:asparagine synthase (glutamine-hydrolysing)